MTQDRYSEDPIQYDNVDSELMDNQCSEYTRDPLPRWLEGPLEEGSIDESKEVSDSGHEQYTFHDSVSRGKRLVKQYSAGIVHETTYSLQDQ